MSAADARCLLEGIRADVAAYATLAGHLERQFQAALTHDAAALAALNPQLLAVCEAIDARRRERGALLRRMTGRSGAAAMADVLARLPETARQAADAWWQQLGTAVTDCKEMNVRNARLFASQHELMQSLLFGDASPLYEAS